MMICPAALFETKYLSSAFQIGAPVETVKWIVIRTTWLDRDPTHKEPPRTFSD